MDPHCDPRAFRYISAVSDIVFFLRPFFPLLPPAGPDPAHNSLSKGLGPEASAGGASSLGARSGPEDFRAGSDGFGGAWQTWGRIWARQLPPADEAAVGPFSLSANDGPVQEVSGDGDQESHREFA